MIGALCQRFGPEVYEVTKPDIVNGIKENLKRKIEDEPGAVDEVEQLSRKMQEGKPQVIKTAIADLSYLSLVLIKYAGVQLVH